LKDRIFGVGYRRLDAGPRHRFAPWPIARTALQLAWRRRATKLALLFCFGTLMVHGVWMISQVLLREFDPGVAGSTEMAQSTFGTAQEVLSSFVQAQFFTTAVAMAIITAGFVADDRHAGAFDLYFARPLTRMDYALGKCLGAGAVPVATIVLPAMLLWFTAVGGIDAERSHSLWRLGLPTLAMSLAASAWLTGVVLGLSSLGEKSRTVGATFIAVLFGLMAFGDALPAAGHDWGGYLSPMRDLRTIAHGLLDVGSTSVSGALLSHGGSLNGSGWASFFALAVQATLGFAALGWRLRREVVG
jgi:ABC-type transport system involved in multi-copper enzyme maturation permease subunit